MKANNVFSVLYRTRVKVQKDDTPILNLSLIFSIIAVCSAPWLAVIGLVVALVLGYRFSIERKAAFIGVHYNREPGDYTVRVTCGSVDVTQTVTVVHRDFPKQNMTIDQSVADATVNSAAANVKGAVNSFTGTENESEEKKDEEE